MNLPSFLIIGAMKCGTTSLYRDLEPHPDIYFPLDKEPADLISDDVASDEGLAHYASHFRDARPGQRIGEASTAYTKLPHIAGVPQRARAALGPDIRLIYIVRDPIDRLISHHRHEGAQGLLDPDPDKAIDADTGMVEYSRYAYQLEPWLEAFDRERLLVLRFEDYIADRPAGAARTAVHLGVEPRPDLVDAQRIYNKSDNKPIVRGGWRRVLHSPIYRRAVRPLLPINLRDRVRHALLPKADFQPLAPSRDLLGRLVDTFVPELERLRSMLGDVAPTWDLHARWLDDAPTWPETATMPHDTHRVTGP